MQQIPETIDKIHDKELLLDDNNVRMRRCRYGLMLYPSQDMYVGRSFDLYGEYIQCESDLFRHFISEGDVVLDVGGNLGASAIPFAHFVGGGGRVFSFEPQRLCFAFLQANIALNSLSQLLAFQMAVSDKAGHIKVPYLSTHRTTNLGSLNIENHEHGDIVACTTLDSLNLSRCNFIKIDVEGMELSVLRGGANLIDKQRPILFVEDDRADKSEALRHWLWQKKLSPIFDDSAPI